MFFLKTFYSYSSSLPRYINGYWRNIRQLDKMLRYKRRRGVGRGGGGLGGEWRWEVGVKQHCKFHRDT